MEKENAVKSQRTVYQLVVGQIKNLPEAVLIFEGALFKDGDGGAETGVLPTETFGALAELATVAVGTFVLFAAVRVPFVTAAAAVSADVDGGVDMQKG